MSYSEKIKTAKKAEYTSFIASAVICFFIKLFFSAIYYGHNSDMGCFSAWSQMLAENGFKAFYTSEAFTDYPPGYMYILSILGYLKSFFSIDEIYYIILKLPAIICDILAGLLIYRESKNRISKKISLILSTVYMLLPSVIINSSFWGQVDSIYTLFVAITLLLLSNNRITGSLLMFSLCVFTKPQSLIFTPVILLSLAEYILLPTFNRKKLFHILKGFILSVLVLLVMSLPFGIQNVFKQYFNTIASYPYFTVNAFNLWGAFGLNWTEITPYFSFVCAIFIILITVISAIIYMHGNGKEKYFTTAAFLVFSTFMLSTEMHERYAFSVPLMLMLAFIYSKNNRIFNCFILTSLLLFFNQAWILFVYETDINYYAGSPVIITASVINICIWLYTLHTLTSGKIIACTPHKENKASHLTRTDIFVIFLITAVYSFTAFYKLGDMKAPETGIKIKNTDTVALLLDDTQYIETLNMYIGPAAIEEDVYVECFADDMLVFADTLTTGDAFYWNKYFCNVSADKVIITTDKKEFEVFEIVLKNENDSIPIKIPYFEALSDEQALCPERVTNLNSTYFDEIYHARTAYEFISGETVYEWTHPPLGKVFIALGIKVFGMNPFGWRVTGTLFGILMIPVIYILLKKIFKKSFISSVGAIMYAFDFMHYTQTRIATIDVYVTFFIMLMYLFMYKYYTIDFKQTSLKKSFLPLLLSGIAFGLGAACKWTACYAAVGLAVIFLITVIRRYKEDKSDFRTYFFKTSLFCVLSFIIIPLLIYIASYIPYMRAENDFSLTAIWQNQKNMLQYHGKTVLSSTHPFSSKWYMWPIMYRPIWYYSGELSETVKEGISAFGNPAVWWSGIPSFAICIYFAVLKKDKKALFISIGYLANLLPWIFVGRTTYIYHYFPCVAFSVLMTCFVINKFKFKQQRIAGIGIAFMTIILFLMFYPVLSGVPVPSAYVENVLKWFNSWVLIS